MAKHFIADEQVHRQRDHRRSRAKVIVVTADFTRPFLLPELGQTLHVANAVRPE